jgi:hypothetical protein
LCVSCDFAKCFRVNIGNSQFNIVFQFLQASWVIRIKYFFLEIPTERIAREYTKFVHSQLLRNWREQRPNNKDDLDSSVTREVGRVCYTEWTCF